jgi:autotransporter-associated beta strand protein
MYDVTVLQIMGAGTIDPAITFSLPGGLPLLDSDDGIHAQTSIHTDYAAGQVQLKAGGVLATTQPCWNQAGGGSWNTGTNWGPPNEVPDHGDERGLFIQTLGGEIPISLNVSPTVSSLIFASPGGESYKITPVGSETITLESSIAQLAHITVLGGSHTVEAGVKLGAGTGPSAGRAIIRLADASHLTLSGVVSDATTASGLDISGNFNSGAGTGVLTLSGANTYTGPTMVTGGVLEAASIANYGAASSIGKPADASPANLVLNNATLRYIGTTAASTDRGLTVAGTNATLESNADLGLSGQIAATGTPNVTKNGVGTLTFNNAAAQANNLGGGVIVAQGKVVFAAGASTSYAMNQIVAGVTGGSAASVNLITGELNVNQRVALGDNTNAGILNQSGGVLTLNGGLYSSDDAPVIGKAAYGCLNVASGSLKFNGQAAGNLYQGVSNTGIINQTGGTIEIANACNYYVGGDDATAGYGLLNITGGDFKMSAEGVGPADGWGLILGIPGTAVLNVSGSGVVNLQGTGTAAKSYLFVSAREAATGIVNLGKVNAGSGGGGGTIANAAMVKEIAGASTFNFHGGTLVAAETTGLLALGVEGSFMDNIDHAYIYSEGARVSVADGHAATIAQAFEDPTGNGVSDASITITNGGSGYLAAPLVTISGGGPNASGATANAVLDSSGNLVDIVVTNPGVNYTEAPTITIAGGGGSGAEATVNPLALVANAAGPFVKVGAGVLTLTGASTRTGDTIVDAGTLNVMALNTPSATISVKDGAVLNVGSIIADTLTIGGAPEVNASAVPEPATWLLLILAGFGGLVAFWRRKP